MSTPPVTSDEHLAAFHAFNEAADDVPKSELRERMSAAVQEVRNASGRWDVYAESWDMPGPGHLVSQHSSEAEALTECRRLNQANQSDAGGYTIRRFHGAEGIEKP